MKIVEQPDIFLREPTSEVKFPLSSGDQIIIDQMIDTMYKNNGVGLAANQVGYARRMFVIDTSNDHNSPQIFINTIIEKKASEAKINAIMFSIYGVTFAIFGLNIALSYM